MREDIIINWRNLATEKIWLRYPELDLIALPSNINNQKGKYSFRTFIRDKNSKRIILVEDTYVMYKFKWESLEMLKKRFIENCEMYKNNYIFNKDSSIQEPYEINF